MFFISTKTFFFFLKIIERRKFIKKYFLTLFIYYYFILTYFNISNNLNRYIPLLFVFNSFINLKKIDYFNVKY